MVNGLDGAGYKRLGARVCNAIGAIVGAKLPKDRSAYHELVTWISGTQRPHPVEIFTTNYDLLLEEAFETAKVPYFDGFTGGHPPSSIRSRSPVTTFLLAGPGCGNSTDHLSGRLITAWWFGRADMMHRARLSGSPQVRSDPETAIHRAVRTAQALPSSA